MSRRLLSSRADGVRDDLANPDAAVRQLVIDPSITLYLPSPISQQHAAGEQKRGRRGIHNCVPHRPHALRSAHVVIARGMHVQPHVAVRGVDEHVVGPAGDLQVSVGFQFGGVPVVAHFVGANHVIPVVDDDVAGQCDSVARPLLPQCLPFHWRAGRRRRFRRWPTAPVPARDRQAARRNSRQRVGILRAALLVSLCDAGTWLVNASVSVCAPTVAA